LDSPEIGGLTIFVLVLAVFAIIFVAMAVVTVRQGFEYTLVRFGRYTRTLSPGLHIIVPLIDRIGRRINVMENVLDVPIQEIITRDNAMVAVDGVLFFQVLESAKAAYEVTDLEGAILNLSMTNIRTVMGSMDLDELLSHRDRINAQLLTVVDEATSTWGVKVTRIEILKIQPPEDLVASMARQMKAERDKRANILDAEGVRQADILRSEGEKQSAILKAEGERESAFRDAEARERLAEAEAFATNEVSQAIADGNLQAINYFIAQRYIDALGAYARSPGEKVLFLPLEATSIVGTVSGVAALAEGARTQRGGEG
jgi:regulator of protease activity HflC (stomatin/prohibitin superfamily)